jgi:SEC-C motif-containing protein
VLAGGEAATAEVLMRSRFTAHVVGDDDHLHRSWHPDRRPPRPHVDPALRWLDLTIVAVDGGGPLDVTGTVEFVARHAAGAVRERSGFARLDGRWVYVAGTVAD